MFHTLWLSLLCVVVLSSNVFAQSTVFLVRHAERADMAAGGPAMMAADPQLSDAGHARAAALAHVLKDAGITAIFVTEYKRTQQTAAPLATALGIEPVTVHAKDTAALIAQVNGTGGSVLVVGHSNTVPDVIKALGITAPVVIDDAEFDRLFIVTSRPSPQLIQLRYR